MWASLALKVASLLPNALIALWSTRQLVAAYGIGGMAFFSLVISIPLLIPFADLGLGGAVTEMIARRQTVGRREIESRLRRTFVVLVFVCVIVFLLGVLLTIYDVWPVLLSRPGADSNLTGLLVISFFSLSIPATMGYRILLGLGRNRLVVLLQAASAVFSYLCAGIFALQHAPIWVVCSLPGGFALAAAIAASVYARFHLPNSVFGAATLASSERLGSLRRMAWPMALIAVAVPAAYQSDRLILAHLADVRELAVYAAAFQLYAPANSVITAAGQALWPRMTSLRTTPESGGGKVILGYMGIFGLVGVIAGASLILFGPWLSSFSTKSLAAGSSSVFISFAVLLVVNAINYPVGMFLMGGPGLIFQAVAVGTMAVFNVILSICLAPVVGAAGPVIASVVSISLVVVVPCFIYASRLARSNGRTEAPRTLYVRSSSQER